METSQRPAVGSRQRRKSLLTWGIVAVVLALVFSVGFDNLWREVIIRPLLNVLLFLYAYLVRNFIISITALTLLLRLITMPLQRKSIR